MTESIGFDLDQSPVKIARKSEPLDEQKGAGYGNKRCMGLLEARAGIEPTYEALQASA